MKVLLCHNYYRSSAPSGEDAVFENEKKLLVSAGIDVNEYILHNDDINEDGLFNKIKLGFETSWSAKIYSVLHEKVKLLKPDIVHFHNTFPQMSPSAYKACQDHGVPVIQTLHNYRLICPGALLLRDNKPCELCLSEAVVPLSALKYKCYRNSLSATSALVMMIARNRLNGTYKNQVSRYIALTEFAADKMKMGGIPKDKITVKPNFVYDSFGNDALEKKITDYAVFVGRLSEEKGVQVLLKAFKLIDSLPLKILGDGPLADELKKYAKNNSLNVEFMGYQDKQMVLNIVRNSRFLVVPSEWYEGFPMTVLEALSVGTPIVASRIGSLDEIIEEGITGIKFEPGNYNDLSNKICRLLEEPGIIADLSVNARKTYERKYNPESNLKMLMNIYEQVL